MPKTPNHLKICTTLILLAGLFFDANAGETLPKTTATTKISPQQTGQINPLIARAYQHLQHNEAEAAYPLYQTALQQTPGNRDALLGLATIAASLNDRRLARHYLNQRLATDPQDPQALAGWFNLAVDDGTHESRLKSLLNQHPAIGGLHFALGNVYAHQSRWSEAQRAYENACRLAPANPAFNLNLAISLDHLGQTQAAARHYREAVRLNRYHHAGLDTTASTRLRDLPWP
ncbi:MAG: tetratricopeptide repeat protein [Gallionella sp.]|nr:tetratricopeptide repeat protein [Gallionella sp.]